MRPVSSRASPKGRLALSGADSAAKGSAEDRQRDGRLAGKYHVLDQGEAGGKRVTEKDFHLLACGKRFRVAKQLIIMIASRVSKNLVVFKHRTSHHNLKDNLTRERSFGILCQIT